MMSDQVLLVEAENRIDFKQISDHSSFAIFNFFSFIVDALC